MGNDIYIVVMAGGSGTRFWPASRSRRPKQLLALTGTRSLLQQTVDRVAPLAPPERVLVVTGQAHAGPVARQLPQLPPQNIIAEPQARNTAPAAGLAAAWVARRDPQGVCVVLPADHLINGEDLFLAALEKAAALAGSRDVLVTLGLAPTFPATGFGYIEGGEVLDESPPQLLRVEAFHEKPDSSRAKQYLGSGRHFWNSGMFIWRAEVFLAELKSHLPALARGLHKLAPSLATSGQDEALARAYSELPKVSVDHGVLERARNIVVIKADFGWSDLGSWHSAGELWPHDAQGNSVGGGGEVIAIDAENNVVSAGGRLTALLGVKGLVAVVTEDVLLILPRKRAEEVRRVVAEIKERGLDHLL